VGVTVEVEEVEGEDEKEDETGTFTTDSNLRFFTRTILTNEPTQIREDVF
jgi:hypothetical protein